MLNSQLTQVPVFRQQCGPWCGRCWVGPPSNSSSLASIPAPGCAAWMHVSRLYVQRLFPLGCFSSARLSLLRKRINTFRSAGTSRRKPPLRWVRRRTPYPAPWQSSNPTPCLSRELHRRHSHLLPKNRRRRLRSCSWMLELRRTEKKNAKSALRSCSRHMRPDGAVQFKAAKKIRKNLFEQRVRC